MPSIYCFSGTGNSLFAATQIAKGINAEVLSMTNAVNTCNENVIGFIFPTYYWGLPRTVKRFVKELVITSDNPYIFAVTSYGTSFYGALELLDKILRKKGAKIDYGYGLKSVENYIPGYKINNTDEIIAHYNEGLKEITSDVAKKALKNFSRFTIVSKLGGLFFPANNCDKLFTVSEECTGCGLCRDICPSGNINVENEKPVFLHHCEHCISCVHICPNKALDWKNGAVKHGRYRHPDVSVKDLIANTGKVQGSTK